MTGETSLTTIPLLTGGFIMVLQSLWRLRSYRPDSSGRSVLIGLTFEETQEFERLDASPPLDKDGRPFPWPMHGDPPLPDSENRWLKLYERHAAALRMLDQIKRNTALKTTLPDRDENPRS